MKKYEEILHKMNGGHTLSRPEIREGMASLISTGDKSHIQMQMGMILFAMSVRKPTVDEILGLVDFVRDVEPKLGEGKIKSFLNIVGVAGSGKKGLKTINVSTAASLVAASAGAYIAKPVSHATSSLTGSADILRGFGAELSLPHTSMMKVLEREGFGAFQIENAIPVFDSLYGGKFFAPHALSYVLAGLINPVECSSIIYGLTGKGVDVSAEAFSKLGFQKGMVLSSTDDDVMFIDELSPLKKNRIAYFGKRRAVQMKEFNATEVFGCPLIAPEEIKAAHNRKEQMDVFIRNLSGQGPEGHRHMIAMNAAVILMEGAIESDPRKAFQMAVDVLHSGVAEQKLFSFCEATREQLIKLSASPFIQTLRVSR